MSAHFSTDFFEDDGGWWPARCHCGWDGGMFPAAEDAADALMDHAQDIARRRPASRREGGDVSGRRFWIWRSGFGWWVAVDPDAPVATFDTPTCYRSWSREKLIEKMHRKLTPSAPEWEEIAVSPLPAEKETRE